MVGVHEKAWGVQLNDKAVNELRRETIQPEPEPEFPVPTFLGMKKRQWWRT